MAAAVSAPRSVSAPLALVVEDVEDARTLYARHLRSAGYVVLEAANGQEAIAMALAELPCVIVMDLEMPVMDGWAAARWLKAHAQTARIPIVAVSAHERSECGTCEADAFLAKPCGRRELLSAIESLTREGGGRLHRS